MQRDDDTTIKELKKRINMFFDERNWMQFHSPKNSSMDIAVEAAELMEKFQWCESKESYEVAKKILKKLRKSLPISLFQRFVFLG